MRTPIIACSGNAAGAESEKKFRVAGADLVWGKPFPNFTDGSMQRDLARLHEQWLLQQPSAVKELLHQEDHI